MGLQLLRSNSTLIKLQQVPESTMATRLFKSRESMQKLAHTLKFRFGTLSVGSERQDLSVEFLLLCHVRQDV